MSREAGQGEPSTVRAEASARLLQEQARLRGVVLDLLCAANPARDPASLAGIAQRLVHGALFGRIARERGLPEVGSWAPPEGLVVSDAALAAARGIERFDCGGALDVSLYGRCFEKAVDELETLRADQRGEVVERQRRQRQREGIFFTPSHVAQHIVDETLGGWMAARRAFFGCEEPPTGRSRDIERWMAYREALCTVRVLDLACGAGAFLTVALDVLRTELRRVDETLRELKGGQLDLLDRLGPVRFTDNIFGVDLGEDAVGVCRRALWLEASQADVSPAAWTASVRVGDALVADPDISPRAFPWDDRFAVNFDVIVGNPPYDVLASGETGAANLEACKRYVREHPVLCRSAGGKQNLYKVFLCQMIDRLAPGGWLGMIGPMALMGDRQARGVRGLLFERCSVVSVDAFPQKDDPARRVFPQAKLSTCVLVARARASDSPFRVRVQPADRFEVDDADALWIRPSQLARLGGENRAIPACGAADWELVERVLAHPRYQRLGAVAKSFQGEINETTVRKRGPILTKDPSRPPVLRGANLTLYAVREASQGESFFVDEDELLARARPGAKVHHARCRRVGFQRSSPQNNFRRLIAAPIPPGRYCFDTVSYVTEESSEIDLDALLALLDSRLYDYWFRLTSTNSKVNEYQWNDLPWLRLQPDGDPPDVKGCVAAERWDELERTLGERTTAGLAPDWIEPVLAGLARSLSAAESARRLSSRSERSRLGEQGARLQHYVDRLVYALFGVGRSEQRLVERRLPRTH